MNRIFAVVFALFCAAVSVSSACFAQPTDWVSFTLQPEQDNPAKIHASFRDQTREQDHDNWSAAFMPSELIGMEVSSFHGSGTRPLHFAIVREAGRLDCAGDGGNSYASGNCRFTADPGFTQLLLNRGIGQPNREKAFGLMAVNARPELINSLAAARYPMPTIGNLMALSALRVDGRYIADMSRAGYRPATLETLIQFKALGITPDWIAGFARIGYANLPGNELVQIKALGITPEFIASFDRLGYRHLPVDQLVQLRALNITPEFVQRVSAIDGGRPAVNKLVQLKALGVVR